MDNAGMHIFIILGVLFLIGLATDILGRMTRLPRVTLLLIFGFVIGPSGLAFIPDINARWIDAVTNIALVMVGFLLGEQLTVRALKEQGMLVLSVSLAVLVATMAIVAAGLVVLGLPLELALLMAAMSTATDPAASIDVAHEVNAKGPFTRAMLDIVAVDDIWGLLAFSLVLTTVGALSGEGVGLEALSEGLWDLGVSIMIGLALGIPMALLTGRLRAGEPTQAEALGFVFLCAGVALWLGVSFILSSIVLGMTVANLARHHKYPFHEIEGIEWPFLILFFVLAGASLDADMLQAGGLVLFVYVVMRILGRVVGGWIGGALVSATTSQKRWFGIALLPQAGVAVGMALLGAQQFPEYASELLTIAISGTVVFELIGPIFTRLAIVRMGESGKS